MQFPSIKPSFPFAPRATAADAFPLHHAVDVTHNILGIADVNWLAASALGEIDATSVFHVSIERKVNKIVNPRPWVVHGFHDEVDLDELTRPLRLRAQR